VRGGADVPVQIGEQRELADRAMGQVDRFAEDLWRTVEEIGGEAPDWPLQFERYGIN